MEAYGSPSNPSSTDTAGSAPTRTLCRRQNQEVNQSSHRPFPQVYNLTSYPNLVGLFDQLGVATEPSDMSFALSTDNGAFEWGSRGLGALFAQRRNILSPSFWRMVLDVVRSLPAGSNRACSLMIIGGGARGS